VESKATSRRRRITCAADLGRVIRDARRAQKIEQRTLADLTGVTQPKISQIERGKQSATIETYLRLLGELGVDLEAVARS
jgi:HTH-type transcriptional regulator / antitoxin HipB